MERRFKIGDKVIFNLLFASLKNKDYICRVI